jgi:hypothetical protein
VNAAENDRQLPERQERFAQSTRQPLAGPEAVRERRALRPAAQLVRERDRLPFAITCTDTTATTPNDTTLDDRDTLRRRPTTRRATTPRTTPSPPRQQYTKRST